MTTETLNYIKALHMMNENCRKIRSTITNNVHLTGKVIADAKLFFIGSDLKIYIFVSGEGWKDVVIENSINDEARTGVGLDLKRLIEETEEISRCIKLEDPKDMYANYAPPFKG